MRNHPKKTKALPIACDRRGVHTVEMAVTLPILFLMVFAGIEFFRLCMLKQFAENVSYEAARHVIVPGAINSEANDAAGNLLRKLSIQGANVQINPATITDATTHVTVKVSIPINRNQWIAPFFTSGLVATAETTLLTERVPSIQIKAASPPPPPPPPPPPAPPPAFPWPWLLLLLLPLL